MSLDRCEICDKIVDTDEDVLYHKDVKIQQAPMGLIAVPEIGCISKVCENCLWARDLELED